MLLEERMTQKQTPLINAIEVHAEYYQKKKKKKRKKRKKKEIIQSLERMGQIKKNFRMKSNSER